ncbi:Molybdopterin adenylyltransferase [Candidatus Syntrophocurvum alkaliphilum]|uniref:Molybdopterin adenylyltransferase n=1 Tax=Candidatus Syntrophocurvum alkaliphilum TaxID=2293317 RepID=A0A6I6DC71_9FIRM|nr:MogA/MoaB family molybdenum cofactor biosynthesis protein [Candidatus Syntrophocurvum alkaliphilum]QGT98760.1 Molybdopterin adenylyltransferase [Candidatus Syntrophocurvum alkaliphilum]
MFRVGILVMSDKGSQGEREDLSGKEIIEILKQQNIYTIEKYEIIPDEQDIISDRLKKFSDEVGLDVILTSGGTGFSMRDVTPEATLAVLDKNAPGIAEAIRYYGLSKTPKAMLSRGVAGIRKSTLIINLPGSIKGVKESLEAILPALGHGIEILKGSATECGESN